VQASSWCCMCSTFLPILLVFSSPEGYRLQFSIPCAYFVYTVWHCRDWPTLQFYVCVYLSFVCRYVAPLVNVITTLYYVAKIIFVIQCSIACFLCVMHVFEVQASSSYPRLPLCQILFLSRLPLLR